jgi:F-type H+-transporting ATPase subunit delta
VKRRRAAASYAKALFELAKERDQTELVGRGLGDLAAILESDRALRDFFALPWTPPAVKRTVAMEVAQGSGLSKLTSDFVTLVAGRGRTDHIDAIAERYGKMLDEHFGRVRARVRTAVPLTDEERRALAAKIGQVLRSRQVLLDEISIPRCSAAWSWRPAASYWMAASRVSSSEYAAASALARCDSPSLERICMNLGHSCGTPST